MPSPAAELCLSRLGLRGLKAQQANTNTLIPLNSSEVSLSYREFHLLLLENTARPNSSDMSQQTGSKHSFLREKNKPLSFLQEFDMMRI